MTGADYINCAFTFSGNQQQAIRNEIGCTYTDLLYVVIRERYGHMTVFT